MAMRCKMMHETCNAARKIHQAHQFTRRGRNIDNRQQCMTCTAPAG
jgi:hypothetical protein